MWRKGSETLVVLNSSQASARFISHCEVKSSGGMSRQRYFLCRLNPPKKPETPFRFGAVGVPYRHEFPLVLAWLSLNSVR